MEDELKYGVWYLPAADTDRGMPAAVCSCGASKYHMRVKILYRWAERHREQTGHPLLGRGQG